MTAHRVIKAEEMSNVFELIGSDWFLVTAGTGDNYNTMTAAWGGLGILWHKKVCTIYVRPTRHTFTFMEESDTFTLSFFEEQHREVLKYCGSHSGRDVDKTAEMGITPVKTESGSIYFEEARLIFECRKLYRQDLNPELFCDPDILKLYPGRDFHRMYVGEIVSCLQR